MNQSYRPSVGVGSAYGPGQPEPRPLNGHMSAPYGNQCGASRRGSDHLSAVRLPSPGGAQPQGFGGGGGQAKLADCYGQLRRTPDPRGVPIADRRDLDARAGFRRSSPIGEADFDAPSVLLPPSPGSDEAEPLEPLQDAGRNEYSHRGLDGSGRCSPVPNGYLHFGSTLFDDGDIKEAERSGKDDPAPFCPSSRSSQGRAAADTKGSRADKRTYKPTLFNLMSKTISELDPTLSPSALPEIAMSDSDGELNSPVNPGLVSPTGTKSNVSHVERICNN